MQFLEGGGGGGGGGDLPQIPHPGSAIGIQGHFLSETIAQVATACEVPKKTVRSLFEQVARIAVTCPVLTEFLILEPPRTGIV